MLITPAIPPLAQSASAAITAGSSTMDRAASEIVEGARLPTDINDIQPTADSAPGLDPLLAGTLDSIRAQLLTSAGAALLRTNHRNTDTLLSLLAPNPRQP
jgi:hypothetical protein